MTAPTAVPHMIPCKKEDQKILSALSHVFGRKGRAVEVALDWAINQHIPDDPQYPSSPQVHVHLSRNYREQYEPSHLGAMLHTALHDYWTRYSNGERMPEGVWYWSVELPKGVIESIEAASFGLGRDPEAEFADIFRAALLKVKTSLPEVSMGSVEIATNKVTRKLFEQVQDECDRRHLDIDTLLVPAFVTETRTRHP